MKPNPLNEDYPYWDLSEAGLSMNVLSDLDYRLRKALALFHIGVAIHNRIVNIPHSITQSYRSSDKSMIHSTSINEWEILIEASLVFFISCWEREKPRRSDEHVLLSENLRSHLPQWADAVDALRRIRTAKVHPRSRRSPVETTSDTIHGEAHFAIGTGSGKMRSMPAVVHINEQPTMTYLEVLGELLEFSICSVRAERHRQNDLNSI